MDFILHILGLCSDHHNHFNISDYYIFFDLSQQISYVYNVKLKIKNLWQSITQ